MSSSAPECDPHEQEPEEQYVLRLFVVSGSPVSRRAVTNLRTICDEKLSGRYTLEVIDVYEQPALAGEWDILAVPTLVRELPAPRQSLIGDLSNRERLLLALDLDAT